MPKARKIDRPIILGVVGDDATGKTTLTDGIAAILGPDRVAMICADDYRALDRAEREGAGLTVADPAANHLDVLETHIQMLREGKPILKPVYDHSKGKLVRPVYVEPKEYIVVEGMFGYYSRAMRDCFDVKLYLEPEEDLRKDWKVQRDVSRRGYRKTEVLRLMEAHKKGEAEHIEPQRTYADVVIRFSRPEDRKQETGSHLVVRMILRPTLPHPDLSPILDVGPEHGIRLELARDIDGKPVDVLEISADIDDKRAQDMEDLIWGLMPEAHELHPNVGHYTDGQNRDKISHPLALSQLLVTYHLVKAAIGHYAI